MRDPNVISEPKKNGKFRCNPLGKNPTDVWQFPKVTRVDLSEARANARRTQLSSVRDRRADSSCVLKRWRCSSRPPFSGSVFQHCGGGAGRVAVGFSCPTTAGSRWNDSSDSGAFRTTPTASRGLIHSDEEPGFATRVEGVSTSIDRLVDRRVPVGPWAPSGQPNRTWTIFGERSVGRELLEVDLEVVSDFPFFRCPTKSRWLAIAAVPGSCDPCDEVLISTDNRASLRPDGSLSWPVLDATPPGRRSWKDQRDQLVQEGTHDLGRWRDVAFRFSTPSHRCASRRCPAKPRGQLNELGGQGGAL